MNVFIILLVSFMFTTFSLLPIDLDRKRQDIKLKTFFFTPDRKTDRRGEKGKKNPFSSFFFFNHRTKVDRTKMKMLGEK